MAGAQDAELGRLVGGATDAPEPAADAAPNVGAATAAAQALLGERGEARAVRSRRTLRWAFAPAVGVVLLMAAAAALSRLPQRRVDGHLPRSVVQEREEKAARGADADAVQDDDEDSDENDAEGRAGASPSHHGGGRGAAKRKEHHAGHHGGDLTHSHGHGNGSTDGKCGMEDGIDFQTQKALFAMQGIVSAHLCRKKCEEYSQCGAWTWGRTRDDWGLMNMCFLKGLGMDEKVVKHHNKKVVSGLPCRKPDHGETHLRKGLTPASSKLTKIFDVASLMPAHHDVNKATKGTFFCFVLMLPGSYEQGLLEMQYKKKANIFACDRYAVYSSRVIQVVPGLKTAVVDSDLKCEKGGEFGTALNTEIFMAVWKRVIADMVFDDYKWTVKADPDTVFIVSRLAKVVKDIHESDTGVYLNNCRMGMHGPLEVFSRQSIWTWGLGAKECFVYFYNLCSGPCLWGEDMFIDQCLTRKLHVHRESVYSLLTEAHCDPPEGWEDCKNDSSVAFHPFKKLEEYKQCLGNALPDTYPELAGGGKKEAEEDEDKKGEDREEDEKADDGKKEDEEEEEGTKREEEHGEKDEEEEEEDDDDDEDAGDADKPEKHHKCQVEDGVDYETKKALYAMEGIVSAHACRAKCEDTNNCGAWTWGKTRDVWGLTNMCFLKVLDDDEKPRKHKNPKVVSGFACREEKPRHSRDKDKEPSKAMQSTFDLSGGSRAGGRLGRHSRSLGLLFCWALTLPHSYEVDLLRWQYSNGANLFACDSYAVYSNQSIQLAKGLRTSVVNTSLYCHKGGEFGTALNTDIFMRVWKRVISDGTFEDYDWTVKVDPDTVFFASRLRDVLEVYRETESGVYINNCRMGLHGPLEVFSRNAVRVWSEGSQRCFHHFYRLCSGPCLWGEDMFIDQCLEKVLKVRRLLVETALTEAHCDPPEGWDDCKDPQSVAFHPFKKLAAYKECNENAVAASP